MMTPEFSKRVLTELQKGLPLTEFPFDTLAEILDCAPSDILEVLNTAIADKVVRRFGGIFESSALNYRSTLAAVNTPVDTPVAVIDALAQKIQSDSGVTHSYRRSGTPALWFTLTEESARFAQHQARIESLLTPYSVFWLPATEKYKVQSIFQLSAQSEVSRLDPRHFERAPIEINDTLRAIVRKLQYHVHPTLDVYGDIALSLNLSKAEFLSSLQLLKSTGMMRRFAAVLYHRAAGVRANVMAVWAVSASEAGEYGRRLAESSAVSHCYYRDVLHCGGAIPGGLFAMVHAASPEDLQQVIRTLSEQAQLPLPYLYHSEHEYKKSSPVFFESE